MLDVYKIQTKKEVLKKYKNYYSFVSVCSENTLKTEKYSLYSNGNDYKMYHKTRTMYDLTPVM